MWHRLSWRAKTRTKGGAKEELVYPRRYGFKPVIDTMAQQIKNYGGQIRTETAIEKIKGMGDKIFVQVGPQQEVFDKVFITTPVNVFSWLLKNLPEAYVKKLQQIKYRATHVTVLILNKSLMPDGYY